MTSTYLQFARRLIAGIIAINMIVSGIFCFSMYTSRIHFDNQARTETENLTRSLELSISGMLDNIDLALCNEKTEAELQLATGGIKKNALDSHIAKTLRKVPEMANLRLADARGDILYGIEPSPGPPANVADRDYFTSLRDNPDSGLFISKPILGRISKKWIMILARRVNNPDGSFAGVIHGNIQIDAIKKQFASLVLGRNGMITLRDKDLAIVTRYPETEQSTPGKQSITKEYADMINAGRLSGSYKVISNVDGITRTISYRKIDSYPLYINCGIAALDYLAPWYREVVTQLVLLALFTISTLAGARFILNSWKQKQLAVDALSAARDDLEIRVAERTEELQAVNDDLLAQKLLLQEEVRVRRDAQKELDQKNSLLEQEVRIREQGEESIRRSEAKFRAIINVSFVPFAMNDENMNITFLNPAFTRAFGYEPKDIPTVEEWWLKAYPDPDYRLWVSSKWHELMLRARQDGMEFEPLEADVRCKNGTTRTVLASATPLGDAFEGEHLVILLDITEQKHAEEQRLKLEQQLLHAQKLESLGVLAGGIAHDFNNILMAIIGNADLALMRINKESPATENLHRIEQAAARAADLAKQMLAYSGKGKFVIDNISLNNLLEEMLHMLEVSISKRAVLRLNLHEELPPVEADVTQIRQIIMNLVINASEAIGEKSGFIAITTGCMNCDRNYLKDVWLDENLSEGFYVYLEISDSGCGMDKETMSRLFDPFFTTKFTGRGLGMAAVLGIVRGHNGAIKVYSEPGKGTTFKVLLPASDRPLASSGSGADHIDWHGCGTVLLVDDEESVRGIGSEMLKELGFSVITANDGREAIEAFKASTDDFAFVVLDLTMPHMDGEQCFRELHKICPDVKVIMSSGFNEQEVTQKFVGKGLSGFIQKPYKLSTLRNAIVKVLPT